MKQFDRVKETTTSTGTGDLALAGAATGYQAWSARYKNGDTFAYCCAGQGTTEWEAGIGWYNSSTNSVVRQTILESSNSDLAVSFSAGTKDIFVGQPTELNLIQKSVGAVGVGQLVQQTADGVIGADPVQLQDFMKAFANYMTEAGIPFGRQAVYGKLPAWQFLAKIINPQTDAVSDSRAASLPGRFSLSSTLAVTTSDVLAATTGYWHLMPGQGAVHQLWDGTRYRPRVMDYSRGPLQLPLSSLVSGKNYDVVLRGTGGNDMTLALGPAWSGDNTRALAINQDAEGMYYLGGDRWSIVVATIRASANGQCEDSAAKRFSCSTYNKTLRYCYKQNATSHTYNSSTARNWNNETTNSMVEFVLDQGEAVLVDIGWDMIQGAGGLAMTSAVFDSSASAIGSGTIPLGAIGSSGLRSLSHSHLPASVGVGYHFLQATEEEFLSVVSTFSNVNISMEFFG